MDYTLLQALDTEHSDCLIIGYLTDHLVPKSITNTLEKKHSGLFDSLQCKSSDAAGEITQHYITKDASIILVNCGESTKYDNSKFAQYLDNTIGHALKQKHNKVSLYMPPVKNFSANWLLQQLILNIDAKYYQLLDFKTTEKKPHTLTCLSCVVLGATEKSLVDATAIAKSIRTARDLANLPANVCTPTYLATTAKKLASTHKSLTSTVYEYKAIKKLNMGGLLAVAQGSHEEPKFIEIHYKGGAKQDAPVIFVGKGVTFDAGGISLKPPAGMEEMKYDMAGAATVIAIMEACALLKLPVNVIGLIASTENMPGGGAIKPGDIITTMSGQTVEITNTDAEGRLILADALTFAERFNPKYVIDIATLTGAMIVALGHLFTGFMSSDDVLAKSLEDAAKTSQDKVWRIPMDDSYFKLLESPLADMVNASSSRAAGSITAACFLSRFAKKYPWAHLDIAGTAWVPGNNRNATGRPVRLLIEWLKNVCTS